jgi:hypothetical protein
MSRALILARFLPEIDIQVRPILAANHDIRVPELDRIAVCAIPSSEYRFNQSIHGKAHMSRRCHAAFAVAATVLSVTGCGESNDSSKPLTRSALIEQGDLICRRLNTKLTARAGGEGGGLAHLLLSRAAYVHATAAEMRKLTPPATMANGWEQMINGAQTLADGTAKLGEYEQSHNNAFFKPNPTSRAASTAMAEGTRQITATAGREGFKDCAQIR